MHQNRLIGTIVYHNQQIYLLTHLSDVDQVFRARMKGYDNAAYKFIVRHASSLFGHLR